MRLKIYIILIEISYNVTKRIIIISTRIPKNYAILNNMQQVFLLPKVPKIVTSFYRYLFLFLIMVL